MPLRGSVGRGAHFYWPLDVLGRATGAEACLKTGDTEGGTDPGRESCRLARVARQRGEHVEPWSPGSPGHWVAEASARTSCRSTKAPTKASWKTFEAMVKGILDPVDPTYYSSFPAYQGTSGIPRGVSLSYAKYGGPAGAISILNIP